MSSEEEDIIEDVRLSQIVRDFSYDKLRFIS